ncbi:MAG: hypothetical protein FWD01_04750 [Defluviitaleaceae bacterium]|nr:hypothetical protein [Defluviitaleaceae bacterium]
MKKYEDKTGLFEDFNFKLMVIDALINQSPSFESALNEITQQYTDNYEWYTGLEPIAEVLEFFSELKLEQADLDKINELTFGGNEIYGLIKPDWDGEDELFDVHSIKGHEHLKNLESACYDSMCDSALLAPLKEKGIIVT